MRYTRHHRFTAWQLTGALCILGQQHPSHGKMHLPFNKMHLPGGGGQNGPTGPGGLKSAYRVSVWASEKRWIPASPIRVALYNLDPP